MRAMIQVLIREIIFLVVEGTAEINQGKFVNLSHLA